MNEEAVASVYVNDFISRSWLKRLAYVGYGCGVINVFRRILHVTCSQCALCHYYNAINISVYANRILATSSFKYLLKNWISAQENHLHAEKTARLFFCQCVLFQMPSNSNTVLIDEKSPLKYSSNSRKVVNFFTNSKLKEIFYIRKLKLVRVLSFTMVITNFYAAKFARLAYNMTQDNCTKAKSLTRLTSIFNA